MHTYTCVCIYVCTHIYMYVHTYTQIFTHLFIHVCMNTMCIHTEELFFHVRSLSLSFALSPPISLPLSSLSALPRSRHKTTSTRFTNSSNAHCAHDKWREKHTPRVGRGFESQSQHVSLLAHNVCSCNGHIWSHLLAECKSERARIKSVSFAS